MSSRPEHPRHTTGAHRSRSAAARPDGPDRGSQERSGRDRSGRDGYDAYLDGLFTYCLSVLCEHDAATAVLGETLALAERHHHRRPSGPDLYRPWLYALARWACLRRLAERSGPGTAADGAPAPEAPGAPGASDAPDAEARQRELAALAWPEAAGTTPEQREALELSVRHHLPAGEVAAVLGVEPAATRAVLAAARCEVERTRAALAVVERGGCPDVEQLAGDTRVLLGAALRRELVRHVDDCAECRRTAERATAAGPWPGTAPAAPGTLPLVAAPREAVAGAMAAARGSRSGRAEGVPGAGVTAGAGRGGRGVGANGSPRHADSAPRYDRSGFPVGPTDRAARRRRLRNRALTSTVVATVLAAPVLAVWAAYRQDPPAEQTTDGTPAVTANERDGDGGRLGGRYENAGNARTTPDPAYSPGAPSEVSAQVVGADGAPPRPVPPGRERSGPGRLTVAAQPSGGTTVIMLSASGGSPVRWTASAGAPWIQMSRTAGVLRPGESTTITVYVDHDQEPEGPWTTRIAIGPGGTAVTLEGYGVPDPDPGPSDPPPAHPTPRPTEPTPTDPTPPRPTPTPTDPTPTPGPTAPPTAAPPQPSSTTSPAR
ncbi:sigma-70 family RNA polymerase sigma factor [Streptomyces chattanoogensis]|uniref:sigma-70 family RNA polymerase sigma factor n=1 Tax=Streptomyces chattanoogensis TaxID=66876 RepID=UPI00367D68A6